MIVYHHDDLDGITAAAIIRHSVGDGVFKAVNYGDTWTPEEVQDEVVFVVDFSFPDMRLLKESCKQLIWIDHHKTAMEMQQAAWSDSTIKGLRSLEFAGCELTWMFLHPDELMPDIVRYVGDIDMWEFTLPDTKVVAEYANYILTSPTQSEWHELLNTDDMYAGMIDVFKECGEVLLLAKDLRIERAFKSGVDIVLNGLRTRIVNASADASEIGQRIYESGYDLAIVWKCIDGFVVVSFRSNTIGVDEIARTYGGGGHKNAAGAKITLEQLIELYNLKD